MKSFYFIVFVFLCLSSTICIGRTLPAEKDLFNSEKKQLEAADSSKKFQVIKHSAPEKNALYFEFFGSSANLYSVNYDRSIFVQTLKPGRWARISLRIGVNYFAGKYAVPLMLHFSRGREHCFEAGAGWTPWFSEDKRVDGIAAFAGFRFQPISSGLMARFGLTPTYLVQEKYHWRMIYGFSFGFAF